jgi:hypothetical protein
MIELSAMLVGQAIGVLLWSAILNAPILQWRARSLRNWHIKYKHAYLVSIKAGFIALIVGDAAVLSIAISGNTNEQFLNLVGFVFGLTSWWFSHSSALLKLADSTGSITVKEARSISTSVIGYIIGGLFALGFVVIIIVSAVSLLK